MLCSASGSLKKAIIKSSSPCLNVIRCKSRHDPITLNKHVFKYTSKDFKELYKYERRDKVNRIELPNFHEVSFEDMSPQEIRMKMKKLGVQPPRAWIEKPVYISATTATFERYVPPEGDGVAAVLSKEGAHQKANLMKNKGKNYAATRKIYQYDEDFDIKEFADQAQDIFIKANEALMNEDDDALHEYVTEHAFGYMKNLTDKKTIRWRFLKSVDVPRAVQVRVTDIVEKTNLFAQITVRLHTQQVLAIYDRFGRLIHGSEEVAVDCLEYIVFERHISNSYGRWRVHDRIVPTWAKQPPPIKKTYKEVPEEDMQTETQEEPQQESAETLTPAVA